MSTDQNIATLQKSLSNSQSLSSPLHIKATFRGIHEWFVKSFEKFGWMLLCKNDKIKLDAYRHSIVMLINAIDEKRKNISSIDKKNDLDILFEKSNVLLNSVDSMLMNPQQHGGERKKSGKHKKSKNGSKSKSKSNHK